MFWITLALLIGIALGYVFCYKFQLQSMKCELDVTVRSAKHWRDTRIETLMEVIDQVYPHEPELVLATNERCWIEDTTGAVKSEFISFNDLYKWVFEKQLKLEEVRKQQLKQQAQDCKSADPMKHRW